MTLSNGRATFESGAGKLTCLIVSAMLMSFNVVAWAEPQAHSQLAEASPRVRLAGHVHPSIRHLVDLGEAPDSLALNHLEVEFSKTTAQREELETLAAAQQNKKSAQYHNWLTPAQYGGRFGASPAAVQTVASWLQSGGVQVDPLPASRSYLGFSATKAQVEALFSVQLHLFVQNGKQHFAIINNPSVPAVVAPLISHIHGLHDFEPVPSQKRISQKLLPRANTVVPSGSDAGQFVGPSDFIAIYDLASLYKAGITGKAVTIAIAGLSDINVSVANAYWTAFGLPLPSFTSKNVVNQPDPGQTKDTNEDEAYLDVELAGAFAPGAQIQLVRGKDLLHVLQQIQSDNQADIVNVSFGDCEANADNGFYDTLQAAAMAGMTITVSSGDAGVAMCDPKNKGQYELSTTGFAVNGIASSPYVLSVGGTEFDPTQALNANKTNAPGTLQSFVGHTPEMVWNDTCANPLWLQALNSIIVTPISDVTSFCNTTQYTRQGQTSPTTNPFVTVSGTGGGQSSCVRLNSDGTCAGGYPRPSWQQNVYGMSASLATRTVPDVSSIAAFWLTCSFDNQTCDPTNPPTDVDIISGTSAAAPAVAAIFALLDQAMGTRQGLVNPLLYQLAASQYGSAGARSKCSASLGSTIGAGCVFYDLTAGTNAMPCQVSSYSSSGSSPSSTCMAASGDTNGIMELADGAQYDATAGFDLASGIGSINATQLVLAIALPAPTTLTAKGNGTSATLSWNSDPKSQSFAVFEGVQSGQEGATPVQAGATGNSTTISGLQNGQTYYFEIEAQSSLGSSSPSNEAQVTIVPSAPLGLSASASNSSVTLSWSAATGAATYNLYQGSSAGGEAAQPVVAGLTTTSASVTGLNNGQQYFFKVAGVDAGGVSTLSNEASATPVAPSHGGGELGAIETALLSLTLMARSRVRRRFATGKAAVSTTS